MNKQACGALFSIPDLRDYRATTTKTDFPKSFKLNMPEVKNQGFVGSCVAHALSCVAEFFTERETGKTVKLSTGYIYGNRLLSVYKGPGMYLNDALKTMIKFGDVPYELFPDNVEVPYAITRFDEKYEELETAGVNYRFKSYFKLDDEASIKTNLLEGRPVIMSMWWYDDCEVVDGILKTECKTSEETSGHCMVIYGWTETGWLVQNSWGSIWGDKGCFELPYNIPVKETWGVTDELSDSSLVVKKPFSSKIGAFVAKILHKIISWFYNKKNKIKEMST